MSLNWNLQDIEDHENYCWIERDPYPSEGEEGPVTAMNPVTHMLIFATMGVKMGEITEENADEFYARVHFLERVNGPYLYRTDEDGKKEDRYFTPKDIQRHIGLKCNVTTETRAKFMSSFKQEVDRAKAEYKRETREEVAA